LNSDLIGKQANSLGRWELPKMLLFDHTLAFPRLIWAPLFLCFPLIGYSGHTILLACVAMYLFYVAIEIVHSLTSYAVADEFIRSRVGACRWTILGLPAYRLLVFHYRFSGFLVTLKDEQKWTASGPVETARRDLDVLRLRTLGLSPMFWTGMARIVGLGTRLGALPPIAFASAVILRILSVVRHHRS
jgi:hypothetical protein